MAKFNVGDRVQTTQYVGYSRHDKGEQGTVVQVSHISDDIHRVAMDSHNTGIDSTPFTDEEIELVKEKPVFKVGDKVRIKEGAHGAEGYSWATPEGFKSFMQDAKVDFGDTVEVSVEEDHYGEIGLSKNGDSLIAYVLPEFLEPLEEESPKALEPIVVGGEYWNPGVGAWYTVMNIDWARERVEFVFGDGRLNSFRTFGDIETTFPGFCAPVRAEEAQAEAEPETISLSALEEAAKFLKAEDFLQDLLKLAKRLA